MVARKTKAKKIYSAFWSRSLQDIAIPSTFSCFIPSHHRQRKIFIVLFVNEKHVSQIFLLLLLFRFRLLAILRFMEQKTIENNKFAKRTGRKNCGC